MNKLIFGFFALFVPLAILGKAPYRKYTHTPEKKVITKNSEAATYVTVQDITTNIGTSVLDEKAEIEIQETRSQIEKEEAEALARKDIRPEKEVRIAVRPETATDDPDDTIEVNLENTDLQNLLGWVSDIFKVNFLTDDIFNPIPQGGKAIGGNKITFKTHTALTKKQAWDLFITLLDLFGLNIVEAPVANFYKIKPSDATSPRTVNRSPLHSFINVHWSDLPDNDSKIRYIYFVRNSTLAAIQGIVDSFRSTTATLKPITDLNAFILTDKASNIRSIMHVIEELDSASMPEALSVLKLKNADAQEVAQLYANLTKSEDPRGLAARLLGTKKEPTAVYFPENTRLIAEPRTNTLIILGTQEGIEKVEKFIVNHVDTELKIPYSPLYVYELQYTKAEDIAAILTNVTKFLPQSPASQYGGVREGDKYLQAMTFKAEPAGNRLLIKAEKEDYLKVREVIRQLDVKQPQIAVEVLIVNVIANDNREIGVQIRNKDDYTINSRIDFQTSGFPRAGGAKSSPIVNPTDGNLMGNLINLATSQSPGATLISVANGVSGVWAMFKLLETHLHTNLISNPFLVTTNKYTAEVSVGEQRYVKTGEVKGTRDTDTFDYIDANLTVKITPQINSIGVINLDISITIDTFTDTDDPTNANRDTKNIRTNANVGNKEVLALGGLLKRNKDEMGNRVPILGEIPVLGWFFRNKTKVDRKDNLLVFISPRIIEPRLQGGMSRYSQDKACHAKKSMREMVNPGESRDPIYKWFFKDTPCENTEYIDDFIAKKHLAPQRSVVTPHRSARVTNVTLADNDTHTPQEQKEPVAIAQTTPPKQKRSLTDFMPSTKEEVV